jgi:ArsR family transcriptional regulator, arsenate/arsenite/antimonite-responsive transcriptional repressor
VKGLVIPLREKGVCSPVAIPDSLRHVDGEVEVLKALADPTRLRMVGILRRAAEPVCICDFTAAFNLTQPTISHHMGKLRDAGLVDVTRRGIWSYYRLRPGMTAKIRALLDVVA